jgi:hypothetical protein
VLARANNDRLRRRDRRWTSRTKLPQRSRRYVPYAGLRRRTLYARSSAPNVGRCFAVPDRLPRAVSAWATGHLYLGHRTPRRVRIKFGSLRVAYGHHTGVRERSVSMRYGVGGGTRSRVSPWRRLRGPQGLLPVPSRWPQTTSSTPTAACHRQRWTVVTTIGEERRRWRPRRSADRQRGWACCARPRGGRRQHVIRARAGPSLRVTVTHIRQRGARSVPTQTQLSTPRPPGQPLTFERTAAPRFSVLAAAAVHKDKETPRRDCARSADSAGVA